jgi:SAM-dependent methyltransferase
LLEIGCATGKATLPLAARGFRITCLELGDNLATAATQNLAAYPDVKVIRTTFEEWEPEAGDRFPLVFAATAWGWLDPEVRYAKAHRLLDPGGHLAFWNAEHTFPRGGDTFFREIQDVYEEIGEGLSQALPPDAKWPTPDQLPDRCSEIAETGLFEDCRIRRFDWEVRYDAEAYIDVLNTFSGHIAMTEAQRSRLYGEIRRRLALRPDGKLRRHWGVVLHVARCRD